MLEMNGEPRKGLSISYFLSETETIAKLLHHSLHVKKGDIVALYVDNCVEFPTILVAAWLNQAIASAGDLSLSEKVLILQIKDMMPSVIFCTKGNLQRILNARKALDMETIKIVVIDATENELHNYKFVHSLEERKKEASSLSELPKQLNDKFDCEDVLLILWSSGMCALMLSISLTLRFRYHRAA